MKRLPAIALFAFLCCADPPPPAPAQQPVCSAEIQGRLWPDEANTDKALARKLIQSGDLEMCSLVPPKYTIYWKYKWQFVSVNARNLAKNKRPDAAQTSH